MELRFEQLSIDIDGERGCSFDGWAGLYPDRDYFYVRWLIIEDAAGNPCELRRSGSTLNRALFAAIEATLYDEETHHGRHAREAWAAHCEQEREDAA